MTAIVAGMAVSFLLYGYALIYWRNADMDFMVIYNALVLNDGKPQLFFDHTGYITILSVKTWFELLHRLGLLDSYSLSAIPAASDPGAFDAAMTSAVRAGRILAFLIATGCVLVFAALMRVMVRDWRVALIATFAFAFSGGVAVHSRILRSELVAACPVIFALMILIAIGRRASVARPLGMAVAAALCMIGLENKVQVILLIGALPVLVMPFGSTGSASVAFWRQARSGWPAAIFAALAAMAAAWAAWPLIATGFDRALLDAAQFHPLLLGRFGIYQAALLALIGGCMIAYALIWRVSAAETLTSMCAVAAGASVALLALNIEYNPSNVIAVFNPLEKMLTFADASTAAAAGGIRSVGNSLAPARWNRIDPCALHLCAALLATSDRISHLADRARHYLCVETRRKTARDPGSRPAAGSNRNRRAWRAARVEIRIFHLHRSPDHPRRRDSAGYPDRATLS